MRNLSIPFFKKLSADAKKLLADRFLQIKKAFLMISALSLPEAIINICSKYGKYNIQCNGIGTGYIATSTAVSSPTSASSPDHPSVS